MIVLDWKTTEDLKKTVSFWSNRASHWSSPLMTGWPGARTGLAVAACTPLAKLPVESASPTWQRNTIRLNSLVAFLFKNQLLQAEILQVMFLTRRGLADMRFPFFSSSDNRGDGGGVAFWVRSLFCGESSTRAARPPSLGPDPGGSAAGRNTPMPWAC